MEKVIFLDMDGVLAFGRWVKIDDKTYEAIIEETQLQRFAELIEATKATVILSSAWRRCKSDRKQISEALESVGVAWDPENRTPDTKNGNRADEIQAWLDKHPEVKKFAVLDDDATAAVFGENYFQTYWPEVSNEEVKADPNWETTFKGRFEVAGLTTEVVSSVVEHLGGTNE